MKATDQWLYICACCNRQECPAIDYMVHNLDYAKRSLLSSESIKDRYKPEPEVRKAIELMIRRLYRILSHAYYHHKDIWAAFEEKTSLTTRFTQFAIKYALMPDDLLIIPRESLPEAEEKMD